MTIHHLHALGLSVSMAAAAMSAAASAALLNPGVWKSVAETTIVTEDGSKVTPAGRAELTHCLSPQFIATNPYFSMDAALGAQATKVESCRYWPIAQSVTAATGVLRMRFECKLKNESLIWAMIDTTGTPNSVQTKLRVFREGGTGYVDLVNRMTRSDEPCTKDIPTLDARSADKTKSTQKGTVVTQPSVSFAGETYFYDGLEMAGTATHNNYYRAEESSVDWRKEFSTSHFPNTESADEYIALINANERRPLLKGTKIETLAKTADGKDVTISQLSTSKRDNGEAFVMHSVARIIQRPDVKGVKIYRLETDHDGDKLPSTQAIGELNKRYAQALSRLDLPVYDAEGKTLATSVNAVGPITFNGQSYRFDTGTVTLTHIFNGYAPNDEDANTAPRSLWVNVYPTAESTKEIIEWTKEQFDGKLLKGTKFESLIKATDGSTETLLYLMPTDDGRGFEMSIARFTKDADGVKIYRYHDTFAGTLVEQAANVRGSMRKIAALLAELNIPVVNEERVSPFTNAASAVDAVNADTHRGPTESELKIALPLSLDGKTYAIKSVFERSNDVENFYFANTETLKDHTSNLRVRLETNANDPLDRCKRFGDTLSEKQVAGTQARVIRNLQNGKDVTCHVVIQYDKDTIAFYVMRIQKVSAPDGLLTHRFYKEVRGSYTENSAAIQRAAEAIADQLAKLDRRVVGKIK